MKRISFFFQSSETGPKQKIEADFSEEEFDQLEGYLLQIADLNKTKLI